ncbi:ketopantoate reductase family protein [Bacillus weihaiensis]|uniref:2-dehydropantoate 2-reductase n=1 Tax=Bacillus weihaiensis TaxID=1547283 RepID=A0A1L3MT13_9BACI|nr:ketopantoate reductase family protein [Bacillus weihaiensis]APH05430.1 2-dehydropantoate 2-reductase [Bacillus weihaiensis]
MRVLVVGAGAVGGYFGGRLVENRVDVTFLVRERRQRELKEKGLVIQSVHGDFTFKPQTIISGQEVPFLFDVILVGTKSYHFKQAIEDISPYVSEETLIIPMLNGIKHLHDLETVFPKRNIAGGLCFVESTVGSKGEILQTSGAHQFVFGERSGQDTERIKKVEELFSGTKATIIKSQTIMKDMWHKYMFITGLSGITTLFRSSIGPIRNAEYGLEMIQEIFYEIGRIMRVTGAPIDDEIEVSQIKKIKEMDETMKSSMQRDMEKNAQIEADHLQGYLLELAEKHRIETPYLRMIYSNLHTYELQKKE